MPVWIFARGVTQGSGKMKADAQVIPSSKVLNSERTIGRTNQKHRAAKVYVSRMMDNIADFKMSVKISHSIFQCACLIYKQEIFCLIRIIYKSNAHGEFKI